MSKIESFSGKYRFLSNFYPCTVELDGEKYSSVEHAYQAAKTLDIKDRQIIRDTPQPNIVKKLGRYVTVRNNWEEIKLEIMSVLVWQKFSTNEELRTKLLETQDYELIEGNWWNDTYWGICKGVGQNNLGKILMAVRSVLEKN